MIWVISVLNLDLGQLIARVLLAPLDKDAILIVDTSTHLTKAIEYPDNKYY